MNSTAALAAATISPKPILDLSNPLVPAATFDPLGLSGRWRAL
jgi:hypothetical protein